MISLTKGIFLVFLFVSNLIAKLHILMCYSSELKILSAWQVFFFNLV